MAVKLVAGRAVARGGRHTQREVLRKERDEEWRKGEKKEGEGIGRKGERKRGAPRRGRCSDT